MNTFTHRIDFGFGIQLDKDKNQIAMREQEKMLDRIGAWANHQFGGYTLTETVGSWVNPGGYTFSERGRTLTVYTDQRGTFAALGMAERIKEELRQEAVMVSITEVNARII